MIQSFVFDIAAQMGVELSTVSLTDGRSFGCVDTYLLNMTASGKTIGAILYKADIEKFKSGAGRDFLEVRIRSTLSRLHQLIQS
jgi:hypothetical protein